MTGRRSWIAWLGVPSVLALLAVLVLGRPGAQPEGGAAEQSLEDPGAAAAQPGAEHLPPQEPALNPAPREDGQARSAFRSRPAPKARKAGKKARHFDEEGLTAAGFKSADVVWLSEHFEAAEIERARLRAAAQQAGRRLTAEERQALWQFESELQEQLGDEAYDRLLHASGDPNRAQVRWVSTLSPAEAAGLAQGDIILRYDGSQVFRYDELRWLIEETPPGTTVPIDFQRGEEVHRTDLVTGPPPRRYRGVDGLDVIPRREEP